MNLKEQSDQLGTVNPPNYKSIFLNYFLEVKDYDVEQAEGKWTIGFKESWVYHNQ